jgi:hypothetical protein
MEEFVDTSTVFLSISSNSWWTKEHELWYTVLSQALERFQILIRKPLPISFRHKNELTELMNWFYSPEEDMIGSFLNICDICHINSGKVRMFIRRTLQNKNNENELVSHNGKYPSQ